MATGRHELRAHVFARFFLPQKSILDRITKVLGSPHRPRVLHPVKNALQKLRQIWSCPRSPLRRLWEQNSLKSLCHNCTRWRRVKCMAFLEKTYSVDEFLEVFTDFCHFTAANQWRRKSATPIRAVDSVSRRRRRTASAAVSWLYSEAFGANSEWLTFFYHFVAQRHARSENSCRSDYERDFRANSGLDFCTFWSLHTLKVLD